MASRIRLLVSLNIELLEKNYEKWALLRQQEWIDYVVMSLDKLTDVKCNLDVEHIFSKRQDNESIRADPTMSHQVSQAPGQTKLAVITTEQGQSSSSVFSNDYAFSPLSSAFDCEPPLSMGAIEKVEQQIIEGDNETYTGLFSQEDDQEQKEYDIDLQDVEYQVGPGFDGNLPGDLMFVAPVPLEEEKAESEADEELYAQDGDEETDDILAVLNIIESGKHGMRVRRVVPVPKPQRQTSFTDSDMNQLQIEEDEQQSVEKQLPEEVHQDDTNEDEVEQSADNNVQLLDESRQSIHEFTEKIFQSVIKENQIENKIEQVPNEVKVDIELTGLKDHPIVLCLHVPHTFHRRKKTIEINIIEDYYQSVAPIQTYGFEDQGKDGVLVVPQAAGDVLPQISTQQLLPLSSLQVVSARTIRQWDGGEYTNYIILVIASDKREWRVEHRFSEFIQLRGSLKSISYNQMLPPSWDDMNKARTVFGALKFSAEVVESRRIMLQRCMQDLLSFYPDLQRSRCLLEFLAPQVKYGADFDLVDEWDKAVKKFKTSAVASSADNSSGEGGQSVQGWRARGRIRLVLNYPPEIPTDTELFRLQEGKCASCGCILPALEDRSGSFFSWSTTNSSYGPRRCEYLLSLYCHDCHRNETDRIPAHIIHKWDFTRKPVSGLAHEYLQSISTQPLISVGDMNPGLLARVPTLARAHKLRKQASSALKAATDAGDEGRCEALLRTLGERRYLIERPEYYSVRDLTDIAKGAFAELPDWLEGVNRKCRNVAARAVLRKKQSIQQQ
eukprot:TRINITY_DN10453_c0_g1_i1.p1 TRINITY_DN10453_c0_g1~~TRINITY_DN10453_c0_g1_i1.p1  ORF type:complete len:783 (+),score=113.67 TRINITY_DN10453_c0_g1_i1:887-3235(+)